MTEAKLPRLLKGKQVEEIYGIKNRSLIGYAKHGVIKAVRVGRQIFYDRLAIESFIESGGKAFEGGWKRITKPRACRQTDSTASALFRHRLDSARCPSREGSEADPATPRDTFGQTPSPRRAGTHA
jgi:hypothetical protein